MIKALSIKPLLTDSQLKIIADIGIAAGQLSAASMILPFILPGLDQTKTHVVVLGILLTCGFWLLSIFTVRKVRI